MRLIQPSIYRLGKTSRWSVDLFNLNAISALTSNTLVTILQGYLGNTYNMFILKCDILDTTRRGGTDVNVIFYKYIQRSRLVKSRRMLLLIAAGMFHNKPPLYHVRLAQGFTVPAPVVIHLQTLVTAALGTPFILNFFNIGQTTNTYYSKLDRRVLQSIEYFMRGQEKRLAQTRGTRSGPPLESRVEAGGLNPLAIRDNYPRYKAFSSLAYSTDVMLITLYASIYALSNLMADLIIRGLLRNMKRHKQFLTLVETTVMHLRTFTNWPFKPTDGCIALHGKIGSGVIRSRSQYIKIGYLPLQSISLPVNYTYRQADTKYGSIGVKVWMRHP